MGRHTEMQNPHYASSDLKRKIRSDHDHAARGTEAGYKPKGSEGRQVRGWCPLWSLSHPTSQFYLAGMSFIMFKCTSGFMILTRFGERKEPWGLNCPSQTHALNTQSLVCGTISKALNEELGS